MIGSLVMAKYSSRLPEGTWIVFSVIAMGIAGVLYGFASPSSSRSSS